MCSRPARWRASDRHAERRRSATGGIMKIGLVGLGRMGSAIFQRLRGEGFDLVGWDHDASAAQAAAAHGLAIAASAEPGPATSDVVISIITEDNGVRKLFTGPAGFLAADVAGK